jgi:Tfp pilus assembly protein PilZ
MEMSVIRVEFDDIGALTREFESNLCHGGTFARGSVGFEEQEEVELILVHPRDGAELQLSANVVWVVEEGDGAGVGLAVQDFGPAKREAISAFIRREPRTSRPLPSGGSLHERLRGLSVPEQQKVAKGGDANERVVLERIYGKMVWESILRNPRVTVPEVARIANMGALPRHLFEIIGANNAFLRVPQVRRALLGNPKTPPALVDKVLRLTPRAELRLVPAQVTYPRAVRDRARKLLQTT